MGILWVGTAAGTLAGVVKVLEFTRDDETQGVNSEGYAQMAKEV